MKHNLRIAIVCLSFLFLFGFISLVFLQKQPLKHTTVIPLTDHWDYSLNKKASVPLSIPTHLDRYFKQGDTIDLYTTLPLTPLNKPYLHTKFYLLNVNIFLDNELIYTYEGDLNYYGEVESGSGLVAIPLPENYAHKTLHIQYEPRFNYITNYIFPISLQDKNLTEAILENNIETLYLNAWFLFAGLLCIGFSIYLYIHTQPCVSFFFLGLFAIVTAIWFLCNTKCLQLITQNLALIHHLEYLCFYAISIPLWLFFYGLVKEKTLKRYCLIGLVPSILFFVAAVILHTIKLADFFELLSFYHILIGINFLFLTLLIVLLTYKKHPLSQGLLIGILCLILSGALEILKFYTTNIKVASFINYGLILFFLNLIYAVYRPLFNSTKSTQFLKHHV